MTSPLLAENPPGSKATGRWTVPRDRRLKILPLAAIVLIAALPMVADRWIPLYLGGWRDEELSGRLAAAVLLNIWLWLRVRSPVSTAAAFLASMALLFAPEFGPWTLRAFGALGLGEDPLRPTARLLIVASASCLAAVALRRLTGTDTTLNIEGFCASETAPTDLEQGGLTNPSLFADRYVRQLGHEYGLRNIYQRPSFKDGRSTGTSACGVDQRPSRLEPGRSRC